MVEGEEAEGREGQGEEGGEVCHFVWGSFAGRRDCLLKLGSLVLWLALLFCQGTSGTFGPHGQ